MNNSVCTTMYMTRVQSPYLLDELVDELIESEENIRLGADHSPAFILKLGVLYSAIQQVVQRLQKSGPTSTGTPDSGSFGCSSTGWTPQQLHNF